MFAHTEMLAAYVANGEGQEGSPLKVPKNLIGDNLIVAEAGEEHRVPDFATRRCLGRVLLKALRLATFQCKESIIHGQKGVQK